MSKPIARTDTSAITLPLSDLGPPGSIMRLQVVPLFQGDTRTSDSRVYDKTLRKFTIACRISRHHEAPRNINFDFSATSGDSYFSVPDSVTRVSVKALNGEFFFDKNENGRLSSVTFECLATSIEDARLGFQKVVVPALDHLAYVGNSPLHVVQISINDETNQVKSTEILRPYPDVGFDKGVMRVTGTMSPVYAMYREAKNAASPFYRFFCFYKILEGLLKPLRAKVYEQAKELRIELPPLQAKVPSLEEMDAEQSAYIGKSINRFFEEYLTRRFRNAMAHFVSDEGAVLHVSELEDIERYNSLARTSDACCREVIAHFSACCQQIEGRI